MLSVVDLNLERYFQPVFEPVSFELSPRQLLAITGPNGSGKTTLIRMLAGLLTPTSGVINNGFDTVVYLGHEPGIKSELDVRENLRFCKDLHGASVDVESAIATMGLQHVSHQAGRTLSAGQMKRAALARLVMVDAPLWLLDEPYTNMDANGVELVDRLLDKHLAGGGACVMATHGAHRPTAARTGQNTWDLIEFSISPGRKAA